MLVSEAKLAVSMQKTKHKTEVNFIASFPSFNFLKKQGDIETHWLSYTALLKLAKEDKNASSTIIY